MKKLFWATAVVIVIQTIYLTFKGNRLFGFQHISHLSLLANSLLAMTALAISIFLVRMLFDKNQELADPKNAVRVPHKKSNSLGTPLFHQPSQHNPPDMPVAQPVPSSVSSPPIRNQTRLRVSKLDLRRNLDPSEPSRGDSEVLFYGGSTSKDVVTTEKEFLGASGGSKLQGFLRKSSKPPHKSIDDIVPPKNKTN